MLDNFLPTLNKGYIHTYILLRTNSGKGELIILSSFLLQQCSELPGTSASRYGKQALQFKGSLL